MTCDDRKTAFHLQYICYFLGNRHIFSNSEVLKTDVEQRLPADTWCSFEASWSRCTIMLLFYIRPLILSLLRSWLKHQAKSVASSFLFLGEYPIVAGSRQILPVLSKLWSNSTSFLYPSTFGPKSTKLGYWRQFWSEAQNFSLLLGHTWSWLHFIKIVEFFPSTNSGIGTPCNPQVDWILHARSGWGPDGIQS